MHQDAFLLTKTESFNSKVGATRLCDHPLFNPRPSIQEQPTRRCHCSVRACAGGRSDESYQSWAGAPDPSNALNCGPANRIYMGRVRRQLSQIALCRPSVSEAHGSHVGCNFQVLSWPSSATRESILHAGHRFRIPFVDDSENFTYCSVRVAGCRLSTSHRMELDVRRLDPNWSVCCNR
jgi:hypothetical protein